MTLVPLDPTGSQPLPDDPWSSVMSAIAERQDRQAFAQLFGHFAPRVKRYLMQGGSPEAQAEELTQEALVSVWRKATQFDPARAAVSTWIFTIARNLRVDALRRRQGLSEGEPGCAEAFDFDQLESEQPGIDEHLHTLRLSHRLLGALNQLPTEQQQVLRLSYYEDEPHARIAAELNIPLGTVKSRLRLAVAQLRRLMEC